MSLFTKSERITVKPLAKVPTLLDLPHIERAPPSISDVSSFRGVGGAVDLSEGCFISKATKYTHRLMHWVNVVRDKSRDTDAGVIVRNSFMGVLHCI
jgi:hypothetical protein